MKHRSIPLVLAATVLLVGSVAGVAADKAPAAQSAASQQKKPAQEKKPKPVDINRASASQLRTVPGIGDAEAERIIKGRPYPTKAHLVTEKVLSYETYLAVKDRLVAMPIGKPKTRKEVERIYGK